VANQKGKAFEVVKMALVSSVRGYVPVVSIEFARKLLHRDLRPTFADLEAELKGKPRAAAGADKAGRLAFVAVALRARRPGIRIWGVETEGAQAMTDALAAGGPVPTKLTSSVSTLCAPTVSQLTYDHVSTLVTDVLLVTDAEAVQGTLDLADHAKVWAEPARLTARAFVTHGAPAYPACVENRPPVGPCLSPP